MSIEKKRSLPNFLLRSKIPSTCRYSNTATDDEVNFSFLFLKSFQHRPAFNYEAGAFFYFDFPNRSLEVSKSEETKPSKIIWRPLKSEGGKIIITGGERTLLTGLNVPCKFLTFKTFLKELFLNLVLSAKCIHKLPKQGG